MRYKLVHNMPKPKKNEIKANFQNDLVDLSRLSVPSVTDLKKTFKNLDVAKGFDYAAFKK